MTNMKSQHQVIKTKQSEQFHDSSSDSNKNSKDKKLIRMKDAVPTNSDLLMLRDQANLKSKMPISDTTEASCFSEKNITEFIRVMDILFHKFFIITAQKKLECLVIYSSEAVLSFYDMTSDFHDENYEKVCWKLKKHYAKENKAQQINNLHWLEQFINIYQKKNKVGKYLMTFHRVSNEIVKKEQLTDYLQAQMLLKNLSHKMCDAILDKENVDSENSDEMEYEQVYDFVKARELKALNKYKFHDEKVDKNVKPTKQDPEKEVARQCSVFIQSEEEYPKAPKHHGKEVKTHADGEFSKPKNDVTQMIKQMEDLCLSQMEMLHQMDR